MGDFWKGLFGWICGFLIIVIIAIFGVGIESGEGFFGVIENIASKTQFDPFENIKKEAYNKGFIEGREEGYSESERDSEESYNKGYENGYSKGLSDGKQEKLNELAREDKTYDAGYRKGYEAGKNAAEKSAPKIVISEKPSYSNETEPENPVINYVLNKNTKKFHLPWCASVDDIKSSNRWDFSGTREEVIAKGYVPCKRCYP